jgi:ABC-type phosphate transport system permease subunit
MIRLGGALVVAMVCLIVLDIARQALPLFLPAAVASPVTSALPAPPMTAGCGAGQAPCWTLLADGRLIAPERPRLAAGRIPGTHRVIAADHDVTGLVAVLSSDQHLVFGHVVTSAEHGPEWRPEAKPLALDGSGWLRVSASRDGAGNVSAVVWDAADRCMLAHWSADSRAWQQAEVRVDTLLKDVAVARDLRRVALTSRDGLLTILSLQGVAVRDRYRPLPATAVAVTSFLASGGTLIAATPDGEVSVLVAVPTVRIVSSGAATVHLDGVEVPAGATVLARDRDRLGERALERGLDVTSVLPRLHPVRSAGSVEGTPTAIAGWADGRSFLVGTESGHVGLFHATSGRRLHHQRWTEAPAAITELATAARGGSTLAVSAARLIRREIHNPHPEVSWRTLLLPVWYEGYREPAIVWQSTGGSEAFEPKLSLTPLLFGTLKAALYALVLALPLALLAAVYTAQLAPRWLAQAVKPAFELMAAVPSVVIGFVAGLWLAPILERHLLTTLLLIGAWPVIAVAAAMVWRLLPATIRRRLPSGSELVALLVTGAAVVIGVLAAAPALEGALFGGDLPRYLFTELGLRYDQRNALLAGIALAFAVIPVIFTIAEDACSAVPIAQISAARALGATRWQTTRHLVLPAAAPGLVAAVVLGLGRALGETMIVLMATGNTPIIDLSPFDGMRTLSAAIAVEIPEAPVGGTLFRVLFLAGFLLFLLTLIVTTVADLVSESVRRRYGTF